MRALDATEAIDRLRLIRSQNVGPATFHALLARYGNARAALEALPALAARGGRREPIRVAGEREVAQEMAAAERLGARYLFHGTPDYPPALALVHAPPPVLMVRGDCRLLVRRPVAVVGSRKASAGGRTMAQRLCEAFADAGHVVVSGLALGIDAQAHRASLEGGTVAVLAGGVDRPTPEENHALAEAIAECGALVSEMPLGWVPRTRDYPRRNRIIAGLAEAVVVVEAAARSGTLYTARFALEAGREVFAVPGSPLDPRAAGCLGLLRDGAAMVVEPRDVLEALAVTLEPLAPSGLHEPGASALACESAPDALALVAGALNAAPVSVDALVRATGLAAAVVAGALVELELAGRAEREDNGTVRGALAAG